MAAAITEKTGKPVTLESGSRGEFSVWVGGTVVARKGPEGFPMPDDVVAQVLRAL